MNLGHFRGQLQAIKHTTMLDKIAQIQDKIGTLVKDTKAYNYKYVDLNQIIEKLTPLLREEGLILTQPIINGNVVTKISQWNKAGNEYDSVVSEIKLPENIDPQKLGSAITYFRRYTLVSLLALTSEEDDDGASATGLSSVKFNEYKKNYEDNKVAPPIEEWEKMSYEQKKIINEIKIKLRK